MVREGIERRLAAILSADVAGYSRLMSGDEAGTLAALKAHRAELIDPTVTGFGGRIVKLNCVPHRHQPGRHHHRGRLHSLVW